MPQVYRVTRLRFRVALVLLGIMAGGGGSALGAWHEPAAYRTAFPLLMRTSTTAVGGSARPAALVTQAVSLAEVADTAPVQAVVAAISGVSAGITVLAGADGQSPYVNLEVTGSDPEAVRRVAGVYEGVLPQMAARLGQVPLGSDTRLELLGEVPDPVRTDSSARAIAIGLLMGAGLGLAGAIALPSVAGRLRDAEHVEAVTHLPVLAGVPLDDGEPLPTFSRPSSPRSEGYHQAQTALLLDDQPTRTLLVTSTRPGEGTTALAANLAVDFAQAGERVVVVDAHVRSPGLHRVFDLPAGPGLAEVLRGEAALESTLTPSSYASVTVLTAGNASAVVGDAIASARMQLLLEQLSADFDRVVVDGPPALADANALRLGQLVDGAVLVVRRQSTSARDLSAAQARLNAAGTALLGIVLTGAEPVASTSVPSRAVPSRSTLPARLPLRLILGATAFVLLAGAILAWVGLRGMAAQNHLQEARSQLRGAQVAALDRRLPAARSFLAAAGQNTARARALTSDPVWRLVAGIPYAGASVETAGRLASNADILAREVAPAALRGLQLTQSTGLRRADGSVDLAQLAAITPLLVDSAARTSEVRADLAELPQAGVLGRVGNARDELVDQVAELDGLLSGVSKAAQLAPALLGADRPRRFVVLLQQNAESRGTGGLPGGFAVVEVDGGRISVVETASNADAPDGPVAVPAGISPEYFVRYGRLGAFDRWVNVNVSPDLPSVARVVAQRFELQRGLRVDGVVAVDAQALAALLTGSPPIALANGRLLMPSQLPSYLGVGQYADFATPDGTDVSATSAARKDALSGLGGQTAARLARGGASSEALLLGLVDAVRSGHLRMASDDPALVLLGASGIDGRLPDPTRPVAYPVVVNATGGKLDQFVDRSVRYTAYGCDGATRISRIEVTLVNRAPADGLPPYVTTRITSDGIVTSTNAAVTLDVYATRGATLRRAMLNGRALGTQDPVLNRFVEGGLPAWSLRLELPQQQPQTLLLDLTEPVLRGAPQVPVQPLARPLDTAVLAPTC